MLEGRVEVRGRRWQEVVMSRRKRKIVKRVKVRKPIPNRPGKVEQSKTAYCRVRDKKVRKELQYE
jgi:hypothetical protein